MTHRAKLDNNEELAHFSTTLERSIIELVESGVMTKDLAINIAGTINVAREKYVNTQEFIDKVEELLRKNLGK